MQRLDFVAVAQGDEAGLGADAFVESEDKGALVAASVIGAGNVAKMMIEALGTWAAAQELEKAFVRGGMREAFATRA